MPTFEEVLRLRERLSKEHGRTIGIIPEIKHSTYFHAKGFNPEKAFLTQVRAHGLDRKNAPLWLQSFEITNLKAVRKMGYQANSTFLAWTGDGRWDGPYDLLSKGDTRKYSDWMKPAGLKEISTFADGIGPEKFFVIPKKADDTLGAPTSLVADAHAVGLKVIPWTFRNENTFMAKDLQTSGTAPSHDTGVRHFSCGWAVDFRMCFAAGVRGSAARCSWPAMLTVISCRGRKARMIFFRLSPVSSCR